MPGSQEAGSKPLIHHRGLVCGGAGTSEIQVHSHCLPETFVEPQEPRSCAVGYMGGGSDPQIPWGCQLHSKCHTCQPPGALPRPPSSPAEGSPGALEPHWERSGQLPAGRLGVEDIFWNVLSHPLRHLEAGTLWGARPEDVQLGVTKGS